MSGPASGYGVTQDLTGFRYRSFGTGVFRDGSSLYLEGYLGNLSGLGSGYGVTQDLTGFRYRSFGTGVFRDGRSLCLEGYLGNLSGLGSGYGVMQDLTGFGYRFLAQVFFETAGLFVSKATWETCQVWAQGMA